MVSRLVDFSAHMVQEAVDPFDLACRAKSRMNQAFRLSHRFPFSYQLSQVPHVSASMIAGIPPSTPGPDTSVTIQHESLPWVLLFKPVEIGLGVLALGPIDFGNLGLPPKSQVAKGRRKLL